MDEMFDFALRRDRLYMQVADQLQELILADSLRPGDKLPSERELAVRMGVSRTVIREAIRVLSDRGLVRARSGCGTYVQELSPRDAAASIELFLKLKNGPHSFRDVYEVRRMIEVEAAGLAAQRASTADHQAMEDAIRGMETNRDDPEQYTHYDVAFHSAVVAATQNDLLNVLLGPISDLLVEVVRVSLDVTDAADQGLAFHRQVLQEIKARDPVKARRRMREHIEHAHRLVQAAQRHTKQDTRSTEQGV